MRFALMAATLAAFLLSGCGTLLPAITPQPARPDVVTDDAPPNAGAREVVMQALTLLQLGYTWGGKSLDSGLDCSGLVSYVYRNATGKKIGPDTRALAKVGRPVARSALKGGDLVFFNTRNRPYSHVGIYVGNGEFVHAFNTRKGIRLDKLSTSYFADRFDGARRL